MDKTDQEKISPAPNDQALVKLLAMIAAGAALIMPVVAALWTISAVTTKLNSVGKHGAVSAQAAEAAEAGETAEGDAAEAKPKTLVFYEPMEFLVNLSDASSSHYLRATLSLGCQVESEIKASGGEGKKPPEIIQKLKSQEPVIRDVIISVISSYTMSALTSNQGKNELKETLKMKLQQQLGMDNLTVYFTAFTLQ